MKKNVALLLLMLLGTVGTKSYGQGDIFVNMAPVDGLEITPDNLLSFHIQSNLNRTTEAQVSGEIRFRQSDMKIRWVFTCNLKPGLNVFPAGSVRPRFTYSSIALRELFTQHRKLPQGIYEYCVRVVPDYHISETEQASFDECVYHRAEDIFLINLVEPEDDAQLYEYNPMLSWTVNYPFPAGLQYRIRVAEIREGQNTAAAISRNNPVFQEKNLQQMSLVYPVYAKPLVRDQPYAWTVDAYYKGILLGGAEPWKFTIIEDSLLVGIPKDPSYVDIKREQGSYNLYAPGILKLKYVLEDLKTDSLSLELLDRHEKTVPLKTYKILNAVYGDNRYVLDLKEERPLKHLQPYTLRITSQTGAVYHILFKYINPELIR